MSEKKKTPTSVYVTLILITPLVVMFIIGNVGQHNGQTIVKPAVETSAPATPVAEPAKWVQPRIYPGVKLYYSHDGIKMRYIGTISDAIGSTINGERTFGITMASGSEEYKYREILWDGHWFMDRAQGQEAMAMAMALGQ